MMYKLGLISLLALTAVSSCGVDSDFSESVSKDLFSSANSELHTLHTGVLEEFDIAEWPEEYSYACPDGGMIMMLSTKTADGQIDDLLHMLMDCEINGRLLNGTLHYMDFEFPDCGGASGFAFDIDGEVTVTGAEDEGQCDIDARESCGDFSGTTCGHDV